MVSLLGLIPSVSYIMDVKVPIIEPRYKITRAREIMRVTGARALPVVNDKLQRKFLGLISRVEILSVTSTKSDLRVHDILSYPKLVFDDKVDILKASKLMLDEDEWYVPVVKDNEYQGMLGLENLIMWLLYNRPSSRGDKVKVNQVMSTDVVYVYQDDPLSKVWYAMLKHNYAGIPVVNDRGMVVGVVTQYDLLSKGRARIRLESESEPLKVTVEEVMSKPAITVSPNDYLEVAAEIIVKRNIGRVIVTHQNRRLVGIVDRADVLRGLMGW